MSFILPLLPGEAAPKAAGRYFDKEIVRMDKAKRKAIIAGNWKMNKTATEAAAGGRADPRRQGCFL